MTVYSQPGRFLRFLVGPGNPLPLKKREVTTREGEPRKTERKQEGYSEPLQPIIPGMQIPGMFF